MLACSQQPRPQGPMPVQAQRTKGRTRSEGREGTNGDISGVKDRKEDGDRNGNEKGGGGGEGKKLGCPQS